MDWLETTTHSFIVKIWLEETAEEAGQAKWRGHITHVPDGVRRYFESLDEISTFVGAYFEAMEQTPHGGGP
ncbi:MAG: hypothetical protein AABN34_02240 [Acidobacteriota bacterium]